jgi:hypothetical protein
VIRFRSADAFVKDKISEAETTVGWFDPEDSEGTIRLYDGPRHGVRHFRGPGTTVTVDIDIGEMAVVDNDGSMRTRFEVCLISGDQGGDLDKVDVGRTES